MEEEASIGIMQLIPAMETKELIHYARLIQDRMRKRYGCGGDLSPAGIRIVGGADASYAGEYGIGVLALLSFPGLEPIGHAFAVRIPLFPYIPGLFAFRELPLLLSAFEKLLSHLTSFLLMAMGMHIRRDLVWPAMRERC